MSDKKIQKAIDAIEPEDGAQERMYRNILKKAEKQGDKAPKQQPIRWVRYALPIAACFCLIVIGLARFLPRDGGANPTESVVLGGNPFVEAENAEAFRPLGITLDAPAEAEETAYAVIDGEIAQVCFSLHGKAYLVRASAQAGDFSGLYGEETAPETVDAEHNAVLTEIQTADAAYQKITWTDGRINYCLYGTDGAEKDEVLAAYEALRK